MASQGQPADAPWQGAVPASGIGALIRIPFPGPGNLVLSLQPPKEWSGKSTCSVFIMQQGSVKKGLRLDYGINKNTNTVNYHWNQQSFAARFPGITNHMPAGPVGAVVDRSARAYRGLGEIMVLYGGTVDLMSIVYASNHLLRLSEVVSAWALAWAGAQTGGYVGVRLGAAGGSIVDPGIGTVVGGIVFGLAGAAYGGYKGYEYGEQAGDIVYGWAADTLFTSLPQTSMPSDAPTP